MDFKAAVGLACACAHMFGKEGLCYGFFFVTNIAGGNFGRHLEEMLERKEGRRKGRRKGRKKVAFTKYGGQ